MILDERTDPTYSNILILLSVDKEYDENIYLYLGLFFFLSNCQVIFCFN